MLMELINDNGGRQQFKGIHIFMFPFIVNSVMLRLNHYIIVAEPYWSMDARIHGSLMAEARGKNIKYFS